MLQCHWILQLWRCLENFERKQTQELYNLGRPSMLKNDNDNVDVGLGCITHIIGTCAERPVSLIGQVIARV